MSGFYRMGAPGEDAMVHLNTGRKSSGEKCASPRFEKDNSSFGAICGRMSVALCDAPRCDKPMCELHRTKHATKPNVDFCPEHAAMAGASDKPACPCGGTLHPTLPLCLNCYDSLDAKLKHAFSCGNPEQALKDAVASLTAAGRISL